jgi:hypothetical protein
MGASASNGLGAAIGSGEPGGCSGTGGDGKLQVPAGVTLTGGQTFISDAPGSGGARVQNYPGTLADTLAQMITGVGTAGCGFEQHLAAIQHALDNTADAAASNAGFLRADALLSIILLADEDDCSLADKALIAGSDDSPFGPLTSFRCTRYGITCDVGGTTPAEMGQDGVKSGCHSNDTLGELTKVSGYAGFLGGLKTDPQDVVLSLIAGPSTPVTVTHASLAASCTHTDPNGELEDADPGVRQAELLAAFPDRASTSSICDADFDAALATNAQLLQADAGTACVGDQLAMPYDCSVSVQRTDVPLAPPALVPECVSSSSPEACWTIAVDAAQCGSGGLALVVQGQENGTHVIATCAVDPTRE